MEEVYTPHITCERVHPILVVRDIATSVQFYTEQLGFQRGFIVPDRMAGVVLDKVSIHMRKGTPSAGNVQIYFVVDDVDALFEIHQRNGVKLTEPPKPKPWGMRQYDVIDPDGYRLQFGRHIAPAEPKLEIERVELPIRLEWRLAAVLGDMAWHKRMNLTEFLEETLLHSLERIADGAVATPHTTSQLAYAQASKKRHGIDYGVHDSYRFIERPSISVHQDGEQER